MSYILFPETPFVGRIYPELHLPSIDGNRWIWNGQGWKSYVQYGEGSVVAENTLAGTKNLIQAHELLIIAENYEYNVFNLTIDGTVDLYGEINTF